MTTSNKKKILLVEDDSTMREFLFSQLTRAGYEVVACPDGLAAYQQYCKDNYSMILTDIVMPKMDGIELARRAAEHNPVIKIMFITGFAAVIFSQDANPTSTRVLSKPFHLRTLLVEVARLLAA